LKEILDLGRRASEFIEGLVLSGSTSSPLRPIEGACPEFIEGLELGWCNILLSIFENFTNYNIQ